MFIRNVGLVLTCHLTLLGFRAEASARDSLKYAHSVIDSLLTHLEGEAFSFFKGEKALGERPLSTCEYLELLASSGDSLFARDIADLRAQQYLAEGTDYLTYTPDSCSHTHNALRTRYLNVLKQSGLPIIDTLGVGANGVKQALKEQLDSLSLNLLINRHLVKTSDTLVGSTGLPAESLYAWEVFQVYARALVLLRNQKGLLPLSTSVAHSPLALAFGSHPYNPFQRRLRAYTEVPAYGIFDWESAPPDYIKKKVGAHETLILSLHVPSDTLSISEALLKWISALLDHHRVVAVMFGPVDWLERYPILRQADALVLAHTEAAQDVAAQALFGGLPINGCLTHEVGGYPSAHGLSQPYASALSFQPPAASQINGARLTRRIQAIIQDAITSRAFPGCQVLFMHKKRIIFHRSYGYHTYANKRRVSRKDRYDLASMTKVLAATTALMKLYEDGHISLTAPLKKYLSGMGNKGQLRLIDILTHQAGLVSWLPFHRIALTKNLNYKQKWLRPYPTPHHKLRLHDSLYARNSYPKKIFAMIRQSPLKGVGRYRYSDLGFYWIPELVRKQTGLSFEKYLQEKFYYPLGASGLGFNPVQTRALPTEEDIFFRKVLLQGLVHDEGAALMGGVSGHAGLFGNALDVAKLAQMYLQGGQYGKRSLLKPETIERFTSAPFAHKGNRRGLGFDKMPLPPNQKHSFTAQQASRAGYGHTGFTGTMFWVDTENQTVFVLLSNRVHPDRYHKNFYELELRRRLHTAFYEALRIR